MAKIEDAVAPFFARGMPYAIGEFPICRSCYLPLESDAEQKIGIHIWCVKNASVKSSVKFATYGRSSGRAPGIDSE